MAQIEDRKAALIAQLERSRAEMSAHRRGAGAQAHLGDKVRHSFGRQRAGWLGGAALLGLILSKLPPRTKKVPALKWGGRAPADAVLATGKAGVFVGALKLVLDLLKPLLIAWATKRIGDVAQSAKRTERKVDRTEDKVTRTEHKVSKVEAKT